ncbi:MAG: hypothetical protein SPG08_05140 [Sodaliphilus sp.]|nr:hypothetical protein [Bacteroidales bacterium]MDY5568415.1 hypothetical protein [Sodaliphilus sp.]
MNGIKNKNIKNSLGATWNAPPPSYEGYPHCPKDKNRSPFHGEKPLMIT